MRGIPASQRLSFRALRNGSTLGTHDVTFAAQADRLRVDIAIDYVVKLGFVAVFRYTLRAQEHWSDGLLQAAEATTNNDGKRESMRLWREGDALLVEGSRAARYRAPAGTILASHWNKAQLTAPMINPQDGSLLRFSVTPRGPARVADSAGTLRMAERYALAGEAPLDLWYDTNGVWVSLQAKVRDGSLVTYLPLA